MVSVSVAMPKFAFCKSLAHPKSTRRSICAGWNRAPSLGGFWVHDLRTIFWKMWFSRFLMSNSTLKKILEFSFGRIQMVWDLVYFLVFSQHSFFGAKLAGYLSSFSLYKTKTVQYTCNYTYTYFYIKKIRIYLLILEVQFVLYPVLGLSLHQNPCGLNFLNIPLYNRVTSGHNDFFWSKRVSEKLSIGFV